MFFFSDFSWFCGNPADVNSMKKCFTVCSHTVDGAENDMKLADMPTPSSKCPRGFKVHTKRWARSAKDV